MQFNQYSTDSEEERNECLTRNGKSKFTEQDDNKLREIVRRLGVKSWRKVSEAMGNRNPRQCRERWTYYLDPKLNNQPFTEDEDRLLIDVVDRLGQHWRLVNSYFINRTDAMCKNRWFVLQRKEKKIQRKIMKLLSNNPKTIKFCKNTVNQLDESDQVTKTKTASGKIEETPDELLTNLENEEIEWLDVEPEPLIF